MDKVIYAKYNRKRRKEFQIGTIIYERDGIRFSRKFPLCAEAQPHIANMQAISANLDEQYINVRVLKGRTVDNAVEYDYITGETVSDVLGRAVNKYDKAAFLQCVNILLGEIFEMNIPLREFKKSEQFVEVFGDTEVSGQSAPITNIDLIFDNLIKKADGYICLDYEWTFDFDVPVDFVKYRAILYFYVKYEKELRDFISQKELLEYCGIDMELAEIYRDMDHHFQNWVFGQDNYYPNYIQDNHVNVISELEQLKQWEKRLKQWDKELYDKELYMKNLEAAGLKWQRLMSLPPAKLAKGLRNGVRKNLPKKES